MLSSHRMKGNAYVVYGHRGSLIRLEQTFLQPLESDLCPTNTG